MKHHQLPYADALKLVRRKRRIVNPNHAFVSQLLLLQDSQFDLSHLDPELLEQQIDNPYDPDEFADEAARKQLRREARRQREAATTCAVTFADEEAHRLWTECAAVIFDRTPAAADVVMEEAAAETPTLPDPDDAVVEMDLE